MTSLVGRVPATGHILSVEVDGGLVRSVTDRGPGSDEPWILPGLVDLQVNGWAGHDLNSDDVTRGDVVGLTHALRAAGTTTYVPTVITNSPEHIRHALATIARARATDEATKTAVPFIHLEGPWISEQDGPRGVHPAAEIREPSLGEFDAYQEASGGLISIVTLSPHTPGSAEFIAALTAQGVRVAIGHTHASGEQIRQAVDAGACLSTHLGNGAHPVIARHPNYIWAQLANDGLTACFIADGHHLDNDTLVSMVRAKGVSRSVLVSDSVALGGQEPGEYRTSVGGRVVLEPGGKLRQADSPLLAGAAAALFAGVQNAAREPRLGLAAAVQMAASNPGLLTGGGRIEPGAPAALLRLSQDLELLDVFPAGT